MVILRVLLLAAVVLVPVARATSLETVYVVCHDGDPECDSDGACNDVCRGKLCWALRGRGQAPAGGLCDQAGDVGTRFAVRVGLTALERKEHFGQLSELRFRCLPARRECDYSLRSSARAIR